MASLKCHLKELGFILSQRGITETSSDWLQYGKWIEQVETGRTSSEATGIA